ncbi:hypothetical protein [Rhizobium sp. BR 362]|uniref:hypothetical protein n=1 Tax=Rhizobium sp. BR 362 TaxID=3040670 RepID=UPI002F41502D
MDRAICQASAGKPLVDLPHAKWQDGFRPGGRTFEMLDAISKLSDNQVRAVLRHSEPSSKSGFHLVQKRVRSLFVPKRGMSQCACKGELIIGLQLGRMPLTSRLCRFNSLMTRHAHAGVKQREKQVMDNVIAFEGERQKPEGTPFGVTAQERRITSIGSNIEFAKSELQTVQTYIDVVYAGRIMVTADDGIELPINSLAHLGSVLSNYEQMLFDQIAKLEYEQEMLLFPPDENEIPDDNQDV